MATERLSPSTLSGVSNLSGALAAIQDDPDSPDTLWLTAVDSTLGTQANVYFPTASGALTGQQEYRVRVRRVGGANNPTVRLEARRLGVLIAQTAEITVTSSTGQIVSLPWTGADPDQNRLDVIGTASGGSPSKRATVEIGAAEWNAVYEVPSTDRAARSSWAEFEVPTAPRAARVAWTEFEASDAPRSAVVAWTEAEVPTPPLDRMGAVAWSEIEVPTSPRSVVVTWAEAEVPSLVASDSTAVLAWTEIEVPTAPRAAGVAWAEVELTDPPRSARISWAALEVPSVGAPPAPTIRHGTITLMGVGA